MINLLAIKNLNEDAELIISGEEINNILGENLEIYFDGKLPKERLNESFLLDHNGNIWNTKGDLEFEYALSDEQINELYNSPNAILN